MPCSDGRDRDDTKEEFGEFDLATRLLCDMLTRYGAPTPEHEDWWVMHQARDRMRRAREAATKARELGDQRHQHQWVRVVNAQAGPDCAVFRCARCGEGRRFEGKDAGRGTLAEQLLDDETPHDAKPCTDHR